MPHVTTLGSTIAHGLAVPGAISAPQSSLTILQGSDFFTNAGLIAGWVAEMGYVTTDGNGVTEWRAQNNSALKWGNVAPVTTQPAFNNTGGTSNIQFDGGDLLIPNAALMTVLNGIGNNLTIAMILELTTVDGPSDYRIITIRDNDGALHWEFIRKIDTTNVYNFFERRLDNITTKNASSAAAVTANDPEYLAAVSPRNATMVVQKAGTSTNGDIALDNAFPTDYTAAQTALGAHHTQSNGTPMKLYGLGIFNVALSAGTRTTHRTDWETYTGLTL